MRHQITAHGAVLCAAMLVSACAGPLQLGTPASSRPAASKDSLPYAHPTVQVRYFSYSPDVTILAWDPIEPRYGLQAVINRAGALVRDHSIYVQTYYLPAVRAFTRANIDGRQLQMNEIWRDPDPCKWGKRCSPYEMFGARIPDTLLRASRDSITVRFYEFPGEREVFLTLYKDVITSYLATVDSVQAELRARAGK